MPTQAQRQRDWEFLAELKPGSGKAAGGGSPEPEGSARDRLFLASLLPSGVRGSGGSLQTSSGSAGAEAAGGPLGDASWEARGIAEPVTGWGRVREPAADGIQLTAYQPSGATTAAPAKTKSSASTRAMREPEPRVQQIDAKIAELEALSAGHHARIRQNRQQGILDSDPRTQKLLHEIQQVLNPRVLDLRAERARWVPSAGSVSQKSGRQSGIFVGDQPVRPASPYAGTKRLFSERPVEAGAAGEGGQSSPGSKHSLVGPPVPRKLLPDTVDPLTLKPILPTRRVTQRQSWGEGDPGTPATVEVDPNEFPFQGPLQAAGRLVPGVGAAIDGHERIYEQWHDAVAAGVVSRAPGLAPAGSAERQAQEASLKQLQRLVEAYNRELTANLRGRQQINAIPLDGALVNAPFERDLPNLYLENGKRWNWQDFGAYLRQHGVQRLSPWETKLLTSAINVRKIEWANKAATDRNIASEVALYVAGEIAGGLLAPVLLNRLARVRGVVKGWKPLQRLTETTEKAAPQVIRGTAPVRRAGADSLNWAQTWARALAPNQENVKNAIANGLQEALTYALTDPDPQADEAIRRALRGGSLGYLFQSGLYLGADGWKRLRGAYHRVGTRPQGELDRIFAAELQAWKTQAGHPEGAATRQNLGRTPSGTAPVEATPPNGGRRGVPEPAPPPKGAQPGTEVTTAPAQQPGAVAVSGEPVFSASVRQSLAQARKDAYARIAERQSRKAPARLPRGPQGLRPGGVIGPDAWGAELGDLFEHAFIGATHLADGVLDRTEWNLRMVERLGEQIRPHLEQIRELAQRIHQGWKDYRIPTQGARVRESARAYLEKLAESSASTAEPAPGAAVSRSAGPRGQAPAPILPENITPDPRLVRNGKLLPDVGKSRRAALERLRSGTGQSVLGVPDSASIRAYVRLGATYLAEGFQNREAWKAKMRAELGGEVEAHLDWLWQSTRESYESFVRHWKKSLIGGPHTPAGTDLKVPGEAGNPVTPPSQGGITPTSPGTYRRGRRIDGGGEKEIYLVEGRDDLVVGLAKDKGHRANLEAELGRLRQLKELGFPVLDPVGIFDIDGRPGMVMPRYEVGSKSIARQAKGKKFIEIVGASKYLNARSIQDLEKIRSLLIRHKISIADLQFLIGRDGQVVINDPLKIVHKEPSDANKKMISKLIEAAQENIR